MKLITTTLTLLAASMAMSQSFKNDTLDINYNATYKDSFNLRASTRLSEKENWSMRCFNAGMNLKLWPGLNMAYEVSRSADINASMISKYSLGYQLSKQNFNLNMSLYSVSGTMRDDGMHGRIDFSIKFK